MDSLHAGLSTEGPWHMEVANKLISFFSDMTAGILLVSVPMSHGPMCLSLQVMTLIVPADLFMTHYLQGIMLWIYAHTAAQRFFEAGPELINTSQK